MAATRDLQSQKTTATDAPMAGKIRKPDPRETGEIKHDFPYFTDELRRIQRKVRH